MYNNCIIYNNCIYNNISSLIMCIQIVCEFFLKKLVIILKFSQYQWIVQIWNYCFLLLFLRLLAAYSLLDNYFMRGDSDFPHRNCLRVLYFQQKFVHFWILPTSIQIYYLNLLLSFVILFRFCYMSIVVKDLLHKKKDFVSVYLLPFTKKNR